MTSLRVLVYRIAATAILLGPSLGLAAKTVMDQRMKPEEALAWVSNNEGKLNAAKSSATAKVYTVKGGEMVIDDIKPDSVRFRLVKN